MGSCQTSEVIEVEPNNNYKGKKKSNISDDQVNSLMEEQRNEFPDMPEWEGDRFTGIGIKKMRGYKCDLPIDKLNKKRDEFWDQKTLEIMTIIKYGE